MHSLDAEALVADFRVALAGSSDVEGLNALRRRFIGKKGLIKQSLKGLRSLPADRRREVAESLNAAQSIIDSELRAATKEAESKALQDKLASEWIDLSMPGVASRRGSRHPLTIVENRCVEVLGQLGF